MLIEDLAHDGQAQPAPAATSEEEDMSDDEIEADMRKRGEDPVVVAQRMRKSLDGMIEESRLRDAVVGAALAYQEKLWGFEDADSAPLEHACNALRAHRAKNGGA